MTRLIVVLLVAMVCVGCEVAPKSCIQLYTYTLDKRAYATQYLSKSTQEIIIMYPLPVCPCDGTIVEEVK